MTKTTKSGVNINVGFPALLGLLFIGLKLSGVISWSWWWVTAPLWGGFALGVSLLLLCGLVAGTCAIVVAACEKLEKR